MSEEIVAKKVSELTPAAELGSTDLLLVQQGGQARALPAGDLQDYCKKGVEQHEANAKAAAEAAAAAQKAAENAAGQAAASVEDELSGYVSAAQTAKNAAETAQKAAEDAAAEVQANAETVAKNAAQQATETIEALVSGAEAAKQAAEDAQASAENAANTAGNHSSDANTARQAAVNAANDATAAASGAGTYRDQALSYSNKALNSANNAESAAERAAESAMQAIGADVNWRATKKIISETLDLIPAAYIAFSNAYSSVTIDETILQPGISYVVRWNDQEYICACHNGDGNYYIGNGELIGESMSNGEPFCIFHYISASNINVWKSSDEAETIYLHVYVDNARYEYSKLPPEHWPDSVPYVILQSSREGSTKLFKMTVDDTGSLRITEVTE